MNSEEYRIMHEVEEKHFWYAALRKLVSREASRFLERCPAPVILDAGCGTGGNLKSLKRSLPQASLYGVDINPLAAGLARGRNTGAEIREASIEAMPFDSDWFDLAVSLDVLYFEGINEETALRECHRVLKKGGRLILNLPAFDFLKGSHDLAVSGIRRYTCKRTLDLLMKCGFQKIHATYWNMTFFPLLALWRPFSLRMARSGKKKVSDVKPLPSLVNCLMAEILSVEILVSEKISLPFGSSLFIIAEKI